jgi:methionyl-tRNA synthetase
MPDRPKFYITTAISYPNGAPHIGHAYEVVATDAIARFKRIDGCDVFFMTGVDEHGLKLQQAAQREGMTTQAFIDRMSPLFRDLADRLNCSYDRFIRTTDADHRISVVELWKRMEANGDIYLSTYKGWYSVRDEAYYEEAETSLRPDGVRIGPQGTPVEWTEEESYFFRLSAYQQPLLKHYEANPEFIGPETRRNEVVNFVRGGLQDLSVSRTTFDWGIPVPGNPRHVMYVWLDALQNYLTGCGFPDPAHPRAGFWPADVHIIGKDIVRFHAVYWPAFLMSAGVVPPKRVYGHGFFTVRGEKMSKSSGNVIDPHVLLDAYGVDALRYFFLREAPFGQDANYSEELIATRINADLANDLGNLAQRSLSMIARNCGGRLPGQGTVTEAEQTMLAAAYALPDKVRAAMVDFQIHRALADIWSVVGEANRYFAGQEPWALRKTDPARMETVLAVTAEVLRVVAILAQPVIPTAAANLLDQLAVPADKRLIAHAVPAHAAKAPTALPAPAPIFPRIEDPTKRA